MKTFLLIPAALATTLMPQNLAQTSAPRLLGASTPAADVALMPETVQLNAVSDDGQKLLLTASGDRWSTNDLNGTLDVFLFDRASAEIKLISRSTSGGPAQGASFAAGMAADASRVVFVSRATSLVTNDTNGRWDVFVADAASGAVNLVSVTTNKTAGGVLLQTPEVCTNPDASQVLFLSDSRELAAGSGFANANVFVRDLAPGQTRLASTEPPSQFSPPIRVVDASLSPSGRHVCLLAEGYQSSKLTTAILLRDLAAGRTLFVSSNRPTEISPTFTLTNLTAAVTADGSRVFSLATMRAGPGTLTNLVLAYGDPTLRPDVLAMSNLPFPSGLLARHLGPVISDAGDRAAYCLPERAPGLTNIWSQVWLWDAAAQPQRRLSSAAGLDEPAAGDALAPKISRDGRFVTFLSRATNAVSGVTEPRWRALLWDSQSESLTILAEAELSAAPPEWLMPQFSQNGNWVALGPLPEEVNPTFKVRNNLTGESQLVALAPQATESSTGRSWMAVEPAGVSADGRYVGLLAFPPSAAGEAAFLQVYLHDTQSGERRLISQGVDGQPGNGNLTRPSLSADGARVLFSSSATNLLPVDLNGFRDIFVASATSWTPALVRPQTPPSPARNALPRPLLSPDGRHAFVAFDEGTFEVSRLVDLESSSFSAPLPGTQPDRAAFSRDGQLFACTLKTSSGAPTISHLFNVAKVMAGNMAEAKVWSGGTNVINFVLSGDGRRVAYAEYSTLTRLTTLRVRDWQSGQSLADVNLDRTSLLPDLCLSDDGRFVVWTGYLPNTNTPRQVLRLDVETGTQTLVSVAADGSPANGNSRYAVISADGRYIAFASLADNLAPGDANLAKDVFLRDTFTGRTMLVSCTPAGASAGGWSLRPFFSANGRSLFFLSYAPDLAANDRNQSVDLFKVEILASDAFLVLQRNVTGGGGQILWAGAPGKQYRLEYKDALDGAAWQEMPGVLASEGAIPVDSAAGAQRFFRLVEQP